MDTKEKLPDIREEFGGRVPVGDGTLGMLLAVRGLDQAYNIANLTDAPVRGDSLPRGENAFVLGRGAYLMPHPAGDVTEPIV